jgi:hypothetical protein
MYTSSQSYPEELVHEWKETVANGINKLVATTLTCYVDF